MNEKIIKIEPDKGLTSKEMMTNFTRILKIMTKNQNIKIYAKNTFDFLALLFHKVQFIFFFYAFNLSNN